jgi:hypothetical protein
MRKGSKSPSGILAAGAISPAVELLPIDQCQLTASVKIPMQGVAHQVVLELFDVDYFQCRRKRA